MELDELDELSKMKNIASRHIYRHQGLFSFFLNLLSFFITAKSSLFLVVMPAGNRIHVTIHGINWNIFILKWTLRLYNIITMYNNFQEPINLSSICDHAFLHTIYKYIFFPSQTNVHIIFIFFCIFRLACWSFGKKYSN